MARRKQVEAEKTGRDRPRSSLRMMVFFAIFVSLLSLAVSLATFVTVWEDGKLLRNAELAWSDLTEALDQPGEGSGSGNGVPPMADLIDWEKLRTQFGEIEQMIKSEVDSAGGDLSAAIKQKLDGKLNEIKDDLQQFKDKVKQQGAEDAQAWVDQALEKVNTSIRDLETDAPTASRDLGSLADEIREQAREMRKQIQNRDESSTDAK